MKPLTSEDKSEISTILAKVLAYYQCGKLDLAREWTRKLLARLAELGCMPGPHSGN